MLSYDAENEMSRRKAEAKTLGDEYWQTAHLRQEERTSRLASIANFLGNLFRTRRREYPASDTAPPKTDRPAFR